MEWRLLLRLVLSTYAVFLSLFFGRRSEDPHLRQFVARIALRALHFIHTLTFKVLASASGNLIFIYSLISCYLYSLSLLLTIPLMRITFVQDTSHEKLSVHVIGGKVDSSRPASSQPVFCPLRKKSGHIQILRFLRHFQLFLR